MPSPESARINGRKGGRPKGKTPRTKAKEAGRARALKALDITAERTMLELARLAFVNRAAVFDKDGDVIPIVDWTPDQAACLEQFEVVVKNAAAGDGHTDIVHKVKLATKHHALELLAKHFGLVTEKIEISGQQSLEEKVAAARAFLAKAKAEGK